MGPSRGGTGEIRTPFLLGFKQALFRLSYGTMVGVGRVELPSYAPKAYVIPLHYTP